MVRDAGAVRCAPRPPVRMLAFAARLAAPVCGRW